MISVKYSQIPGFLCNGSFFLSLSEEETSDEIQIPHECFSLNDNVNDVEDFVRLMKVTAFWGLTEIPIGLITFCFSTVPTVLDKLIGEEFVVLGFAQDLRKIFIPTSSLPPHNPLVNTIGIGRTDVFNYLACNYINGVEAAVSAVEHGRLDYLKLLHLHGHPWDKTVCNKAAAKGCLECLKYLHENGCPWDEEVISVSALRGHLNCMKYAHENGVSWHIDTMVHLSQFANLDMIKYAIENGCPPNGIMFYDVAYKGDVECFRYMLSQLEAAGINVDEYEVVDAILRGGHLECLALLGELEIQVDWDEDWFSQVAKNGRLNSVKYLREHGCPWDDTAPYYAVTGGHADVLAYLIEQGCAYNDSLVILAASVISEGGLQCVQYLLEQRGVREEHRGQLFMVALTCGNYFLLQYLVSKEAHYTALSRTRRKGLRGRLQSYLDLSRL